MNQPRDIAIVGAGPAGMAAATLAGELGFSVIVLDEQRGPGGQVYNSIETSPLRQQGVLGVDYERGVALARLFRQSFADFRSGATVWQLEAKAPGWEIAFSEGGRARRITARQVVLATGAFERPFPVPGWTLAGVMTAGAAQILLKSSGLARDGAVFAGCGPLLYLVAAQYLRAGVKVHAVLDTTPRQNYRLAFPYLAGAMRSASALAKGLGMLFALRRAGVPFVAGVEAFSAEGEDRLSAVSYRVGGRTYRLDGVSGLFLHQGVVPNVHLALSAGCASVWDATQCLWRISCDPWGRTSRPALFVAGDSAGILGAAAAPHRGRLAVLAAASALMGTGEERLRRESRSALRMLRREAALRRFLDMLYRPPEQFRVPADQTIVCRCEEVSAGCIRDHARLGDKDPNRLKSLLRCGMGPCQGRMCGTTLTEILARERGVTPAEAGYFRIRPPIKPIPFEELAMLDVIEAAGMQDGFVE